MGAGTGEGATDTSSEKHTHLNTNIESGTFDEKLGQHDGPHDAPNKPVEDEEEDEDMDALIDELESQDGHADEEEGEEEATPGGGRVVPEDQLNTDTQVGLTEIEVIARRKKYGMNQMKEEKENMFLKFLGYFIGPIQFVMEVCFPILCFPTPALLSELCSAVALHAPPSGRGRCLNCEARHEKFPGIRADNNVCDRLLQFSLLVSRIGSISVLFAPCSC